MPNLTLSIFLQFSTFISFAVGSIAQSTQDLFSLENLAIVGVYETEFGGETNNSYYYEKDTIIENKIVLQYVSLSRFSHRKIHLFVDGSKVYEMRNLNDEYEFRLIMDFDLEVGDSFGFNLYPEPHPIFNFRVLAKDTLIYPDGLVRRKITFENEHYFDMVWHEGVLFNYESFDETAEDTGYGFICASSSLGEIIEPYPIDLFNELCNKYKTNPFEANTTNISKLKSDLLAYPNPCGDNLHFESNQDNFIIEIRNELGFLLLEHDSKESLATINISSLTPGFYIVRVRHQNKTTESIKLLKI